MLFTLTVPSRMRVPRFARWAGHSVAVLLEVYASCLHGQDERARRQVEAALGDVG